MSAEVRMRPLAGPWPYPQTVRRKTYQFRSTWHDTKQLLASEAELLGADLVVVEFDVIGGESAFRLDGGLRANAAVGDFPGVRVSMETRHGPLTYATDRYERTWGHQKLASWQANVRAIAMSLEALRAVDRHGVTRSGEQYTGWRALPGGSTPAPAAEDPVARRRFAARLLIEHGDDPAQTVGTVLNHPEIARRLFARGARKHHPDAGGDRVVFEQLVRARDLLVGAS